jgi:glycosyltransferase involved in cell wall biosynthesis
VLSNKNSFLFEPDNAKDLAEKIQKSTSLDCGDIVNQAYKDVQSYTWDKRAENIKKFIE